MTSSPNPLTCKHEGGWRRDSNDFTWCVDCERWRDDIMREHCYPPSDSPDPLPRQRLGWWPRNAFGPDVEAAGHPDPMSEEDWYTMADSALAAIPSTRLISS
jgi:hypothetical protein